MPYKNRDTYLASQKEYYHKNKERYKISIDRARLKREYNITPEIFQEMYEEQDGCCKICKRERRLVIDHCHDTGVVRGLLCHKCNSALGAFGDDVSGLMRAVNYLEDFYNGQQ